MTSNLSRRDRAIRSGVGPRRAENAARDTAVPTSLARGMQSRVVSAEVADELRQLIPHAEQINMADAGHMVTGDDNDVFTL